MREKGEEKEERKLILQAKKRLERNGERKRKENITTLPRQKRLGD